MNAKTSDRISYGHRLDRGVHPVSQLELEVILCQLSCPKKNV